MSEQDIQRACMEYLQRKGIFCWKNHSGGIYDPKRGVFRKGTMAGVSDIVGVLPQTVKTCKYGNVTFGNFLAIEVKQPKKKPTQSQREFLKKINDEGGIAFVVTSVQELEEKLKEYI